MLDESNPSTTPEEGGDNQAPADKPSNERNSQPEHKIKPRKRQSPKWLGISKPKWREIAGFVVLIPWIYNDLLDCHNFVKLLFLALSLAIAQGVVVSFLNSKPKALTLWFVSLIPLACVVWVNSRPEIKPYPHFALSLRLEDVPDDPVQLTNDFLVRKDWSPTKGFKIFGVLMLPLQQGKTNFSFIIGVKNDSNITPENLVLALTLQKKLSCIPGQGWQKAQVESQGCVVAGKTNAEQSWIYSLGEILAGNGGETPFFQISSIPINEELYFSILLRAKDCPATQVSFNLIPFWMPTGFPPQKGILVEGKLASSNLMVLPSVESMIGRLHK